jgi:Mg2+ and Co2+ transporter CorA
MEMDELRKMIRDEIQKARKEDRSSRVLFALSIWVAYVTLASLLFTFWAVSNQFPKDELNVMTPAILLVSMVLLGFVVWYLARDEKSQKKQEV